ncbi:PREDICTED: acyl-coenzyme A thioesterase 13-like isoform X1 [Fragaria vesca subsp. vesca]|uniref:acyl-coenzyme A thioesterase 13-like isoform X1 n=1 Tax=Fragaria vesca subsp. vesca TaxID=101020 RepID=UPI0002C34D71|nr:PREDICTED: acyl-coenzyme A thioesterase 13-like isoform X1 [Fragaria vesca subsp. vesca]
MEKKENECVELSLPESDTVLRIVIPPQRPGEASFYENFAIRGIRVDQAEPGLVVCTFKVPPRLTDRAGNLSNGAIANLVDIVGSYVTYTGGLIRNVSADISISYMSTAKLDDEVEITSKRLGQKGGYTGILVLLRNKATGDVIAEGRHSMFCLDSASKL